MVLEHIDSDPEENPSRADKVVIKSVEFPRKLESVKMPVAPRDIYTAVLAASTALLDGDGEKVKMVWDDHEAELSPMLLTAWSQRSFSIIRRLGL
jgi:hypothetical protein